MLISCCGSLSAQAGITGRIKTEIVAPFMVVETEQMGFGRFVSEMSGGTIRLSPQGDRVTTGTILLLSDQVVPSVFLLNGSPGNLVTLNLPDSPIQLMHENGNQTLTVDQFTSDVPIGGRNLSQGDGRIEVKVGATLYVGNWASNPPGSYTGTYDAVFMYN